MIRYYKRALLLVLVCFLGIAFWSAGFILKSTHSEISPEFTWPYDVLSVFFLDVGDGDSIFIRTPDGQCTLIDGGPGGSDYAYFDAGRDRILPFFRTMDITSIDHLFLTHPHNDHIGGLLAVLTSCPIGSAYDNGLEHTTDAYKNYLARLYEEKIPYKIVLQGEVIEIGKNVFLQVLSAKDAGLKNLNDASLVMRLSYGDFSLLLSGDIGKRTEEELVCTYGKGLQSTVLKVPHHGSETSSSMSFLNLVSPKLAIISAGNNKRFGNPAKSVLKHFELLRIPIRVTKNEGTIGVFSDGQRFFVKSNWEKDCLMQK